MPDAEPQPSSRKRRWLKRLILPLLIVLAGVAVFKYFTSNPPEVKKRPRQPQVTLVETRTVYRVATNVNVTAMGTLVPAREIALRSRVGGEVVWVSDAFIEGGTVKAGEELLRVDPTDYELALARAEAALVEAEFEVQMEEGQQKVARREWALLKSDGATTEEEKRLALREPHLERVKAMRDAADVNVRDARLDLERTSIRAPFNAVILSRNTELGEQVSTQETLATLAGTDQAWVRVAVPQDRLPWLLIPREDGDPASAARVTRRVGETYREPVDGRVVRLLGRVEEQGRMAELLVEVEDPLGLSGDHAERLPLLFGSYVRVTLVGRRLDSVFALHRSSIRDHHDVWVVDEDQRLAFRRPEMLWRGPDQVLVGEGLEEGSEVVLSDIPAPIEGMRLTVSGAAAPGPPRAEVSDAE